MRSSGSSFQATADGLMCVRDNLDIHGYDEKVSLPGAEFEILIDQSENVAEGNICFDRDSFVS